MEDLKELREIAKNREVSQELLADEEFKSEFKKIMKEEAAIDITDEQIPGIIKKFENALQDEKVLKEAELGAVSGGAVKEFTREHLEKINRGYCIMKLGVLLASCVTGFVGEKVLFDTFMDKNTKLNSTKEKVAYVSAKVATSMGITEITNTLGNLVADKLYRMYVKKKYGVEFR